ncbi:hypothetical protein SEMRO_1875_G303040.1 [Seminavis robusta]|uniref:Uncharacterized protein n=1 Tax=Seminavis robusta TaxID=568900 RepID=A0A9N8HXV4_9STRA|nr:hypothetical protein SEMRO_1875_G303040.1 [Seminavis robusta]|eukprot:Sro1875_g303040.1 n/a (311) ;mRNA; f:15497-16512
MMRAGRLEDFLRQRAEERAAEEAFQNEAIAHHEEEERMMIEKRDQWSFYKGSKILWDHLDETRTFEAVLRDQYNWKQPLFDWLNNEFGGLTHLHWSNVWANSLNFSSYDGWPFPANWRGWATCDSLTRRWTDDSSSSDRLVLTNKDAIYVIFNKLINNDELLMDVCNASLKSGGIWTHEMMKQRFLDCFGPESLKKGEWDTMAQYEAKHRKLHQKLRAPVLDMSNVNQGPVSPIGNSGISGSEGSSEGPATQPPVVKKKKLPYLRPVRTNLKECFDSVGNQKPQAKQSKKRISDCKDDDKKPPAKKTKKE